MRASRPLAGEGGERYRRHPYQPAGFPSPLAGEGGATAPGEGARSQETSPNRLHPPLPSRARVARQRRERGRGRRKFHPIGCIPLSPTLPRKGGGAKNAFPEHSVLPSRARRSIHSPPGLIAIKVWTLAPCVLPVPLRERVANDIAAIHTSPLASPLPSRERVANDIAAIHTSPLASPLPSRERVARQRRERGQGRRKLHPTGCIPLSPTPPPQGGRGFKDTFGTIDLAAPPQGAAGCGSPGDSARRARIPGCISPPGLIAIKVWTLAPCVLPVPLRERVANDIAAIPTCHACFPSPLAGEGGERYRRHPYQPAGFPSPLAGEGGATAPGEGARSQETSPNRLHPPLPNPSPARGRGFKDTFGTIDPAAPPQGGRGWNLARNPAELLHRIGDRTDRWVSRVQAIGSGYWRMVGQLADLHAAAEGLQKRWLKGIGKARSLESAG